MQRKMAKKKRKENLSAYANTEVEFEINVKTSANRVLLNNNNGQNNLKAENDNDLSTTTTTIDLNSFFFQKNNDDNKNNTSSNSVNNNNEIKTWSVWKTNSDLIALHATTVFIY
jgi:hypothetical protein